MLFTNDEKRSLIICMFLLVMIPGNYGQVFASAPTNISGEWLPDDVFNAGIRVKWLPPLHINGALRGYNVVYFKTGVLGNNNSVLTGPSITTVEINDLKFYTNYTILVRAQTLQGDGAWSSPMVFQTREGTPNAFCEVTEIYSMSPTTVFIRWKPLAPEFHRGVLSHYLVMWLAVSDHYTNYKSYPVSLSTRNYTITGLKPYSKYIMAIVGYGRYSAFYILEHMILDASAITTNEDVPSRSPCNLTAKVLCQEYKLQISWTALPQMFVNGRLQGYKVLLYQGVTLFKDVSVASTRVTSRVPLDECKNYTVKVAAFTNVGAGPNSTINVTSSCPCGSPQPLYSNRSIVVREASSFTLPCEYQGRPEPTVFWLRNGKRLHGGTELLSISQFNGNISYIDKESKQLPNSSWYVSFAKERDSGYYTCVMNNSFGSVTTSVTLSVAKGVATVKFQLTLLNKTFHEDLYIKRSAMYRELSLYITKQILRLFYNTSEAFHVKDAQVARFRNGSVVAEIKIFATVDDANLESLASNAIRERLTHVLLGKSAVLGDLRVIAFYIQEPPPAPRDPKVVEAKQNWIQFSWTPPRSHEAYVITDYNLQYKKVGQKTTISTNMLPAGKYSGVISGLTSNTAYEVAVVAYNKYGNQKSEIIRARTADIPMTLILSVAVTGTLLVAFMVGLLVWCRARKLRRKQKEEMIEFEQMQRDKAAASSRKDPHNNYGVGRGSKIVREWWEIPREYIQVGKELGSGAFGEVKKAVLTKKDDETIVCAVKMLKRHATEVEFRDLLNELNIMANVGEHPNIISLIGACTSDGPLWLVVKFAENGSLINYLQSHRQETGHGYENTDKNETGLKYAEKLQFAYGIAQGMNHLAKQRCVHRDVAARNVLLGENHQPMVSDFGLSRDIYESGQYEKTTGGKLPVKWMAIESLEDYKYTTLSDVWSYGVVLWEIESEGRIPYPGINGMEILTKLKTGYRLGKPVQCSGEMYNIMLDCWARYPSERPNFEELVDRTNKLLQGVQEYEEIPDEKSPVVLDASYDCVNIHESLPDLLETCESQAAHKRNNSSPDDLIPYESEKKFTGKQHVNVVTGTNKGENKKPQRKQTQKGTESISSCNEFYRLSEQQKSQQEVRNIGEF